MLPVQSPEAPDEFVLRDQLVGEAAALFKRLGDAFQDCTGIAPRTTHWHAISRAGAAQIAEAERVLGLSLPADLVACYLACTGVTETCGWHWQPFGDIVLNTRMMNTIAYELRADDPTWLMSSEGFNEEGTVRAGFWNRGWLPIATGHGERGAVWLCVDTAPGPNGHWGQILEVEDKRRWPPGLQPALVAAPARRVAKGFMEFFDTLASALELRPMDAAVMHWAEKKNERRLQADLVVTGKPPMVESHALSLLRSRRALKSVQPTDASAASLMAEPEFDLHALCDPHKRLTLERKRRFSLPCKARVLPIEREPQSCRGPENPTGDQHDSETWLREWSESKAPSFVFMTGWMGEGKTDALLALAERMAKRCALPPACRCTSICSITRHRRFKKMPCRKPCVH
jgi:cell wall assembly regulator SMI1